MIKHFVQYLIFLFLFIAINIHAETMQSSLNFASKNFWLLNKALDFYQRLESAPWPLISDNPRVLKIGTKSQNVLLLRERLRLTGDLDPSDDSKSKRFDRNLSAAVASFQERHGLKADGSVGNETREQLNIPPDIRARQIALNLSRWADLAGKLGNRFIIVNIPDFHMYLYENNLKVLSLRAIVGKPDLPTPELASKVYRIVFNPYWNIPPTIAQKDIVPKMLRDPSYVYKMHIRVFLDDSASHEVSASRINWQGAEAYGFNYHLRQDPGPDNALGLVKFEFINSHDVYMHDTSAKNLFESEMRSFSHGCIRLENPFALVEYLLKDNPAWNNEKIQEVLESGETKYVKVLQPIPIFITYITSWVDEEGKVNFRDDVYQLDAEILSPTTLNDNKTLNNYEERTKEEEILYSY